MSRLDVRYINPVLGAIVHILKESADLDVQPGKPSVKSVEVGSGYITGVMGMEGEDVDGSIAMSFDEPVILALTQRSLDEEHEKIDGAVIDTLAEFSNMIAGKAIELYNGQGDMAKMLLPTIIIGHDHLITHRARGVKILLPFNSDIGEFFVEMCFEQKP